MSKPGTHLRRVAFSGRFGHPREEEEVFWTILRGIVLMIIDITIVFAVGISTLYVFQGYLIRPVERGFYCNDASLSKPLLPNTITMPHLLSVSLGAPFLIILLCEGILFKRATGNHRLAKFFSSSTFLYMEYLLVYTLSTLVMDFLKCGVGRLRPHFFAGCDVDWDKTDCKTDPNAFIEDVVCQNSEHRVRVSRTSFPSGHTMAAVNLWLWTVLYLRGMTRACDSRVLSILRWIVLSIVSVWTIVTAITRITDYWHHPTDVLGGLIISFLITIPFFGGARLSEDTAYERREIFPPKVHFH